jgi:hypothetical protein
VQSALRALWKYNFTTDVSPLRKAGHTSPWQPWDGEGGLVVCSFPKGGRKAAAGGGDPTVVSYFNCCFTGYNYEVASHMIWEGMALEGLAITRCVHDRFQAAKRNPYNETECGDHYARGMASYGVFLAACGFEYHGPKRHLGFAPRLTPQEFKAAFTSAEGWGTIRQDREGDVQRESIEVRWGRLSLLTMAFELPAGKTARAVRVVLNGRPLEETHAMKAERLQIMLRDEMVVACGERLEVVVACSE